ncbi:MAG: lipopolysaccharide core heptose(I) kinase RfaP [Burkholderiales bacterium]|nr:lipopolysaccharide core heptose(I) kinase RfaP [Burkholderiales bacterium]
MTKASVVLGPALRAGVADRDRFDEFMAITGEVFKDKPGRRTIRFAREGRRYFIKIHRGVGWKEIFKNLLQLRLPVVSAENERRAIERLHALGVPTMTIAGYGRRGWNPARLESFIVTEDLGDTLNLEDLTRDWRARPPAPGLKRALIAAVAATARRLHENGVNHRDFYLCHLRVDPRALGAPPRIFVMDLHRAQLRAATPRRWIVKDIGSLWFSAMDIGLTRRDRLRFVRDYRAKPLREILRTEQAFWSAVERRAERLRRSAPETLP